MKALSKILICFLIISIIGFMLYPAYMIICLKSFYELIKEIGKTILFIK